MPNDMGVPLRSAVRGEPIGLPIYLSLHWEKSIIIFRYCAPFFH